MAKIMLVEDDNNLREIYGARLLAEGHEIVAAKDGEEALAIAVKEKPDLIISDVMMPRISGFDMLDILRNAPETKETKVIMMTALSQAEDKARADQLGADRYLVKSQVTLEDVARVVKDVLEGKEESADSALPPGAIAGTTTESSAATAEQPTAVPLQTAVPETVSDPAATTPALDNASVAPQDNTQTSAMPSPTPTDPTSVASQPTQDDTGVAASVPTEDTPALDLTTAPQDTTTKPEVSEVTPTAINMPAEPITEPESSSSLPTTPSAEENQPTAAQTAAPSSTEVQLPNQPAQEINSPVAPTTTPPVSIKVELPPEAGASEASTTSAQETPVTPTTPEPANEAEEAPQVIGPNLMEALQQEEQAAEDSSSTTSAQETPVTPTTPEPAIINGAPEIGVVQPTTQPVSTEEDSSSESPVPGVESTSEGESSQSSPLADEESRKKLVLHPINDPTKGPDLNALLEAEESKAAVINPEAASVINPSIEAPAGPQATTSPTVQPAPQSTNEHDVISL
jgi:CheY-like chemotaxis protein